MTILDLAEMLAMALLRVRRGVLPECWCEVAIGNPNYRGEHSGACQVASEAVAAARAAAVID